MIFMSGGFLCSDRRHPDGEAVLGQCLFEHAADGWILMLIFDLASPLPGTLFDAKMLQAEGTHMRATAGLDGKVTRRRRAGVEVLMKPLLRRHDDAAVMP